MGGRRVCDRGPGHLTWRAGGGGRAFMSHPDPPPLPGHKVRTRSFQDFGGGGDQILLKYSAWISLVVPWMLSWLGHNDADSDSLI